MTVTFTHEAMATAFTIAIADRPSGYAGQAAAAAFRELDRLESELSRFIESSDIGRANRLREGETTAIGDDALQCLLLAVRVSEATRGAFDVAFRSERQTGDPASPSFILDPLTHTLRSHVPRLHLDLGAIGKGYALDRMAHVLREWSIESACLESGGSTALAMAAPRGSAAWPVGVGGGGNAPKREIALRDAALSGSGVAVQGLHITDPRTAGPASRLTRAWALAGSAALADALSTAFFVMNDAEVEEFCRRHQGVTAILARPDGEDVCYGAVEIFSGR